MDEMDQFFLRVLDKENVTATSNDEEKYWVRRIFGTLKGGNGSSLQTIFG